MGDMDDDFSAAFLYISPIGEAGWTWAHDQGRLYAEEATGIPTFFVDSIDDGLSQLTLKQQYALSLLTGTT